ncbi:MAG: SagB/ThcOx family dehydrogenase [Thermodesulfovibrionales bacterium]|nr:SagB/ThcOx family dehydrogenase [Thermodesulfovibrionales bacterium]
MNKRMVIILALIAIAGYFYGLSPAQEKDLNYEKIKLPLPKQDGNISVERALLERRSIRDLKDDPLTINEISQLLWAAQGITDPEGFRTAPSAGALYPLEVYVVIFNVREITKGVYKYNPVRHELRRVKSGDFKKELILAASGQYWVGKGSAVIVLSAVYERTTKKYGERGKRYVHMEAGHASQNIYLQAQSLNLGTVAIGAFIDEAVKKVLNMPDEEHPLYLMPVGRRR